MNEVSSLILFHHKVLEAFRDSDGLFVTLKESYMHDGTFTIIRTDGEKEMLKILDSTAVQKYKYFLLGTPKMAMSTYKVCRSISEGKLKLVKLPDDDEAYEEVELLSNTHWGAWNELTFKEYEKLKHIYDNHFKN